MAPLMSIAVEFRGFIATSIPQIIDLFKDNDDEVRRVSMDALWKLSEHGM
jgi:hypothetical protein